MRKLSLWLRANPMIGDAAVAIFVLLMDYGFSTDAVPGNSQGVYFTLGALLILPLFVRRRWPVAAACVSALGGIAQLATYPVVEAYVNSSNDFVQIRPGDLALGFALYTLAAYVGRRQALLYGLLLLIGTGAWAAISISHATKGAIALLGTGGLLIFALFLMAGEYYGARRAYNVEVERRLALLETERDQQARIAVADERARIARELHDVVAHAVSVIIVQADGASYAIRTNPDLAESAVNTISTTGRTALGELRRLLGVLREDEHETELAPQPDSTGLSRLADQIGIPVRLELSGDVDNLPSSIGLNVYRIIQEALTNTLKHGGPDASAVVAVHRGQENVEIRIEDNGTGESNETFREIEGGNGIIGMRERAAMHGGTLEAGPGARNGWHVHAIIPWQPS